MEAYTVNRGETFQLDGADELLGARLADVITTAWLAGYRRRLRDGAAVPAVQMRMKS